MNSKKKDYITALMRKIN